MEAKKFRKWSLCMFLLVVLYPQVLFSSVSIESTDIVQSDNVRTTGEWDKEVITRSGPVLPTVSINSTTLIIQNPSQNCNIAISIIDNEGYTVYEQTVPATATGYIAIPLGGFPSGTYTLSLRNPSGGYLYGYFTIN